MCVTFALSLEDLIRRPRTSSLSVREMCEQNLMSDYTVTVLNILLSIKHVVSLTCSKSNSVLRKCKQATASFYPMKPEVLKTQFLLHREHSTCLLQKPVS